MGTKGVFMGQTEMQADRKKVSGCMVKLEDELLRAISGGSDKIIVNCENLDYISSAGVRLFLEAYHAILRKDGQIILCSMQKHIREIFKKTGFEDLMPIVDNMDQALKTF